MPTYIDPHIHMVSRTTDDYKRMALAGCRMVSEPAFWAGFDRSGPEGFRDYFRQLTGFERKRAALYGIDHYCWLCINAKEAENVSLSREVIKMIPEFLQDESVLGIGEIGLMIEMYGSDRIMVNSAGDWGHSDPLAVPELIFEMKSRGHDEALIHKIVYENPLAFFSQSERFPTKYAEENAAAST